MPEHAARAAPKPATPPKHDGASRSPPSIGEAEAVRGELGPGRPLDGTTRARMSMALGADFSSVRVHTGGSDAALASRVGATAFAIGDDVAFSTGAYRPGTIEGDALLAHELAHVHQQGTALAGGDGVLEGAANRSAAGAVGRLWLGSRSSVGRLAAAQRSGGPLRLQRCTDPIPATAVKFDLAVSEEAETMMDELEGLEEPVYTSYLEYQEALKLMSRPAPLAGLALSGDPQGMGMAAGTALGTALALGSKVTEASERFHAALAAEEIADEAALKAKFDRFEAFFEQHAVNQAYAILEANEKLVQAERARYGDPSSGGVPELRRALEPFRTQLQAAYTEFRAATRVVITRGGPMMAPDWKQRIAKGKELEQPARDALKGRFPILADPGVGVAQLLIDDAAWAQRHLQYVADRRLDDIGTTRARLRDKPGRVWKFELAIERAKKNLNISDDSIFGRLIADRIRQEAEDELFRNLLVAVLAIGLAVLTAGGGTLALFAGAAGAGVSVGVAAAHLQEFVAEEAAGGTAFDRAEALTRHEPSLFWLALDIVFAVTDLGLAFRAVARLGATAKAVQAGEKSVQELKDAAKTFASGEEQLAKVADQFADQVADAATRQLQRQKLIGAAEKAEPAALAALRVMVSGDDAVVAGLLRIEAGTRARLVAGFAGQPSILQRLGRLIDAAPQAARTIEKLGAHLPAEQFRAVVGKYMRTRSAQAPNILRAIADAGLTDADFKAIADALKTTKASRLIGRRFAALAIEKVADRLPKGAEGIAKFRQMAIGLHPNQSAIIFERWASRTIYGHATAERFTAQTAELAKTYKAANPTFKGTAIVTDDTVREAGRVGIVDYKSYVTGKKFDDAAMKQLDNYAELLRCGVKDARGQPFTHVEYLFGTKTAAEKNAATITAKLGNRATIYYVDEAGQKVKYVAGAL